MNPVWNPAERRVRCPWRLLSQLVMHIGGSLLLLMLLGPIYARLVGLGSQDLSFVGLQGLAVTSLWFRIFAIVAQSTVALVSVAVAVRFLDRRRWSDIGFSRARQWTGDAALGFVVGGLLMAGIFSSELVAGWVTITSRLRNVTQSPFAVALVVYFLLVVVGAFAEELVSRGYQLRNIADGFAGLGPRLSTAIAVIASSAVFGVAHALSPNASVVSVANIAFAGIMYGLGYVVSGRLGFSTGLHAAWNFFQGNIFGFTTSGQVSRVSVLGVAQSVQPAPWTGGEFGPEAGLVSTLATLAAIAVIMWRGRTWSRLAKQ